MKTSFVIVPRLIGLGTLIFLLINFLNMIFGTKLVINIGLLYTFLYTLVYTFGLYYANALVFSYLDRKFQDERFSIKRIVLGFVMSFVASLATVFLLRILEDVIIEQRSFTEYIANERASNYVFAIGITFVITLSAYAVGFYKAYKENQIKEQKIIAGTASAQFESLKNQIDPHFLFNSLNVLSSLIEENPESAQKFTTSLSKVYRYVLEQKDKELVSVEEELSFAKTYMNLLKMRFENSLFYELPANIPNAEAKVVPLSLQLLLENTVKHNIVSEQKPLHIRIFVDRDYLCIENDLQKKQVLQDRRGVGLQNIVNRYAIVTKRSVLVEENEKTFTVRIPILTKQITVMETQFNAQESSYYNAQKKVEELKAFYGNLAAYIIFVGGLMVLNLMTSPEYLWFLWPAGGWGIGVAVHAMKVFNYMPFLGNDWEERKIRELMDKDKNKKWK
ncbi:2TM domain-containing protein [Flavobacterium sp. MAH-1]|uniref:2TM domain-containing protein n=1 Tax=Flavobacterium agri TaxID=2743471 RepID=A0A7Y9C7A8_9FLAO|nr:2TM domain-containing protein [Flavobacterium agri]NUY81153.1 2TM domain-containing protein [Flavobacterium agri]NYA71177.1 2TM domain-containing protein [Flavobacterium agri]